MPWLVFLILILLLYLTSLQVTRSIGQSIYRLTGNRQWAVYLLALLFLPGTLLHEMAHLITATFLGVATGNIELIPKIEDTRVIMGSVPIAQTDRVRRALIGAAPFIFGLGSLLLIGWWLANQQAGWLGTLIAFYLCFQIGNTCFASGRDMEGTLELVAAIAFVIAVLFLFGIHQPIDWVQLGLKNSGSIATLLDQLLLLPLGFNLVLNSTLAILNRR